MKITGVHPIAELFPMMSDDELDDLAADIKQHGQLHPIFADDEGLLVDGRNRLEACKRAGVEPYIESLNGHDAVALIMSANIARRQMTKGAMAMIAAKARPETEEVGRGKKGTLKVHFPMVSKQKLSDARTVLRYAPDLADQVIANSKSLNEVYATAIERKAAAATVDEQMEHLRIEAPDLADVVTEERLSLADAIAQSEKRKQDTALLDTIRDRAPDLVQLVEEDRMSVADAIAADASREEIERNHRQGATMLVAQIFRAINLRHGDEPQTIATRLMTYFDPHQWPAAELGDPTPEMFETASQMLADCAQLFMEKWSDK